MGAGQCGRVHHVITASYDECQWASCAQRAAIAYGGALHIITVSHRSSATQVTLAHKAQRGMQGVRTRGEADTQHTAAALTCGMLRRCSR